MPDTQNTTGQEQNREPVKNQWDTIAKDFQALGQSIADAIKEAWQDEQSRKPLTELGTGLQNIADQVAQAVDEAAKSPAASEVKTEVKRAAGEMKELGGKVYSEAKPHLLSTLKTLGESIQTIIERLEASAAHEGEPEPEAAPPKNGD